jgi:hypothetical protein
VLPSTLWGIAGIFFAGPHAIPREMLSNFAQNIFAAIKEIAMRGTRSAGPHTCNLHV